MRELAGQLWQGQPAGQTLAKGTANLNDFLSRLVDKFEAIMLNTGLSPLSQVTAGCLCFGSKHSVATTYVGQDRVGAAIPIPQRHPMRFARLAAIFVTRPL